MGQILHGSARTTAAVRRAIQHSQESLKALSERHGINEKTVLKWKKRSFVHDAPMGPKDPRSTVLTKEEEAAAVAFRRYPTLGEISKRAAGAWYTPTLFSDKTRRIVKLIQTLPF